jgi:hypothetical protein
MLQGKLELEWKIDKELSRNTTVRDCIFDDGSNGVRGTAPAHAIEVLDNSGAKEDFASANTFHNRQRILLES